MYGCRRNPKFRPLGHFVPVADDSGLRPEAQALLKIPFTNGYGRTVGKIIVQGLDANIEQVKAGLAWHYKQYQREQSEADRIAYTKAEEQP
jgi:hypothetical protein